MTKERLTMKKIKEILRLKYEAKAVEPGDSGSLSGIQQHRWGVSEESRGSRNTLAARRARGR